MGWIRRNFIVVLLAAPEIWRLVKWAITTGGDIDFIVERSKDPGWVGVLVDLVTNPPPYLTVPLAVVAVTLIYWDANRRAGERSAAMTLPIALMLIGGAVYLLGATLLYWRGWEAQAVATSQIQEEVQPPKGTYLPLEKQRIETALFEFFESIRTKTLPALRRAKNQVSYWQRHFHERPSDGVRELKAARDEVDAAEKDLFRLLNEHSYVREEWDATIHDDFTKWAPLMPALNNLIAGLERPEAYGPALKIEERWQKAEDSITSVMQWASDTMKKIKGRRNALRNE